MTSLPPPKIKLFPADSKEKKVYTIVEQFLENIPIANDRNRLGYCLYKYVTGEGDNPEILVRSTKIKIVGLGKKELAQKINEELVKAKLV